MPNNIVNKSINSSGTAIKRGALHLSIGNIYSHKDTEIQYEMVEIIDLNQGLFKNLSTLTNELVSIHSLENVTNSNNVSINIDAESISDSDWKKAQHKHLIIEPLLSLNKDGNLLEKIENRAKEYNVSSRTIRRWIDAYKSTGSIASLLDKKRGWDKEKVRLDYATDTLIKKVINDFYLTPQRPTVQAT